MRIFLIVASFIWTFSGCTTKEKFDLKLSTEKSKESSIDESYFYNSVSKFQGLCKFVEINGKPELVYRFDFLLDTSANMMVPEKFFHPDSIYVADSIKFPKGEYVRASDLNVELGLVKAGEQYDNEFVNEAKRNGTYPYLLKKPHYDSKTPKFTSDFTFSFKDEDDIEIYNTQQTEDVETLAADTSAIWNLPTGMIILETLKNNHFEGKLELKFKSLKDFESDVLNRTSKILLEVKNIHVN